MPDIHTTPRGNVCASGFATPHGSRYGLDFGPFAGNGWEQFDTTQDASYFGVWVNRGERAIVTYAEGDVSAVVCPTVDTFAAEIENAAAAYGEPPPAARAIDAGGAVTLYFDPRPTADGCAVDPLDPDACKRRALELWTLAAGAVEEED